MSLQGYRLKGYNYATARGYMVTLKMHPQAEPLVELDASRKQAYRFTRLTRPFMDAITQRLPAYFHQHVKVEQYALMPNHLHLFIRLLACEDRAPINLIHVVHQLQRFLKEAYQTTTGDTTCASPIQSQWHDSIAFDKAAVQRLKAYIRNNPKRALQRQTSHFCTYQTGHAKDGTLWRYYGNRALLESPTILPVECSRQIKPETPLWERWQNVARYISIGGAGIGTFMSPCEQMVRETILEAGGALIILLPEGIDGYWHPSERYEHLCAEGRLLFLTPFEPQGKRLDKATLYQRCHLGGGLKELMHKLARNIKPPPRA
jgi:REP element-mobilizing transposase RayT